MLVLKIGGQDLDDPEFIKRLGEAVAALPEPPILVHGGGKEIKELQTRLGLNPQYIDGLRVTDEESLDVVQMVLIGRINKRLVSCLLLAGVDAFGMSGVDRTAVKAEKLEHPGGDLGQVGRVTHVYRSVRESAQRAVIDPYVDFGALDLVGVVVPAGTASDRSVIEADGSLG